MGYRDQDKRKPPVGDVLGIVERKDRDAVFIELGAVWETENGNLSWEETAIPLAWMRDPTLPQRKMIRFRKKNGDK